MSSQPAAGPSTYAGRGRIAVHSRKPPVQGVLSLSMLYVAPPVWWLLGSLFLCAGGLGCQLLDVPY